MSFERKWTLTRVTAGDYLLPSNDGRTIWRITVYEDGPSYGLDDWPSDRTLWALRRWTGETGPRTYVDLEDWDRWAPVEDGFARRADAITSAVERGT